MLNRLQVSHYTIPSLSLVPLFETGSEQKTSGIRFSVRRWEQGGVTLKEFLREGQFQERSF